MKITSLSWVFTSAIIMLCTPVLADQAQYTCSRDRYVDINTGIDASGRGGAANPWRTIPYADSNGGLVAGDCVHVAVGTYPQNGTWSVTASGNANSPTGYIAWIGAPNHATKILGQVSMYALLDVHANYVVFDGFDIDGGAHAADSLIFSSPAAGGYGHHIQVIRNWLHGGGGSGVALNHSDYRNIEYNVAWDNTCCNPFHTSAINIWEPAAITGFTPTLATDQAPFHIIVRYNIAHDNSEGPAITTPHTDGNAIILDYTDSFSYPYQILVQSNLAYNNGGRCVNLTHSGRATIANNTCYHNLTDPGLRTGAELFCIDCHDVNWYNNLSWVTDASTGTAMVDYSDTGSSNPNIVWRKTLSFNGTAGQASCRYWPVDQCSTWVTNNLAGVNPQLTSPVTDFHPLAGSPVIGAGFSTPSYPPLSVDLIAMPNPPHIGGYNPAGSSLPPPPPPTGPVSINSGGGAVGSFVADIDFSGGSTTTNWTGAVDTSLVTNPAPTAVYQSERYGTFTYTIPGLSVGAHFTVRLHFTEDWDTAAGQRIFNVSINGAQVLTNFDIFAAAGAQHRAITRSFDATASGSGQIVISFAGTTSADTNAKVDGIEVTAAPPPLPPPPPTTTGSVSINAGGGAAVSFIADADFQAAPSPPTGQER